MLSEIHFTAETAGLSFICRNASCTSSILSALSAFSKSVFKVSSSQTFVIQSCSTMAESTETQFSLCQFPFLAAAKSTEIPQFTRRFSRSTLVLSSILVILCAQSLTTSPSSMNHFANWSKFVSMEITFPSLLSTITSSLLSIRMISTISSKVSMHSRVFLCRTWNFDWVSYFEIIRRKLALLSIEIFLISQYGCAIVSSVVWIQFASNFMISSKLLLTIIASQASGFTMVKRSHTIVLTTFHPEINWIELQVLFNAKSLMILLLVFIGGLQGLNEGAIIHFESNSAILTL
ncbi:MAG: hypothetical protein ACD_2C00246G0006 [uncultured bacterium (gcode 4)]|uniref:Uncharacterized protein n=1 Tax=uncultured bacterium (gcode 4) TaxID=1234023 RepID=K2GFE9_9BACT|nr:MAG: hypothetical protein ACD_2C00246G0006 [uncultured bacterium (gcode 4)]